EITCKFLSCSFLPGMPKERWALILLIKKLSLMLLFLIVTLTLFAQTSSPAETIFKDWTMLGESQTQIDVSYRIIKCSTINQVHLFIFNENPTDQTAHFDVEIINTDGQRFSREVTFAVTKANMYRATCNSDASLNALKIDLPANYN